MGAVVDRDGAHRAEVAERPILFSGPMVRAILAGTKTQTRRAFAPGLFLSVSGAVMREKWSIGVGWRFREAHCPYWRKPGDRLWVRETFAKIDGQTQPWIETDYQATYTHGDRLGDRLGIKKRWTPSIHMPRAASRITLEVTCVRVERLQNISEADALVEGVRPELRCLPEDDTAAFHRIGTVCDNSYPVARYAALWEQINGVGSWARNPLVWVLSFLRVGT